MSNHRSGAGVIKEPTTSWTIVTTAGVVSIGQHQLFTTGTLILWCAAMAWPPVLIVAEAVRPRLGYGLPRWATVFPIGMYAVCSFAVGDVTASAGSPTSHGCGSGWRSSSRRCSSAGCFSKPAPAGTSLPDGPAADP